MYLFLGQPTHYEHPWAVPQAARRRWLTEGDLHVAYVYELEDTSTFRYRVFNMVETLRADPSLGTSASWFTRTEFHADVSFVDRADVLVISRTRYDDGVGRLIERAHGRGVLVLFDIDDLVFDLRRAHLVMHTLDAYPMDEPMWDHWFAYIGRLRATMELCDGILTTTEFLAEQIRACLPSVPCAVVPNFLARGQVEESDLLMAKKRAGGFQSDGRVTIGYFSGSPSHNLDLLVASPALATVLDAYPDLYLRMVGYIELNDHLRPFAGRIEHLPLQDFLNLQRVTAECEFSIAPLQMNAFTQSKSELKYFEPAAVGCPTIASPTPPFRAAVTDGVNGYLADVHQWRDRLELLYRAAKHKTDDYMHMVETMTADSRRRYGWDIQGRAVLQAIDSIRARLAGTGRQRRPDSGERAARNRLPV